MKRWLVAYRFLVLFCSLTLLAQDNSAHWQQPPEPVMVLPDDDAPTTRGAGEDFAQRVAIIVNAERAAADLPPLKVNVLLIQSSDLHAENMAVRNFFQHCDPDTFTSSWDRIGATGYIRNATGENIAIGQLSPEEVMEGWMLSAGHRNNILSENFREIGVSYYFQADDQPGIRFEPGPINDCIPDELLNFGFRHYWVQNFGAGSNVYPVIINSEDAETEDRLVSLYLYGEGDATEMRLRNASGDWTAWQPFAAETAWELPPGNGIKTVAVEIRVSGIVRAASDTITLTVSGPCFTMDDIRANAGTWPSIDVIDLIGQQESPCR